MERASCVWFVNRFVNVAFVHHTVSRARASTVAAWSPRVEPLTSTEVSDPPMISYVSAVVGGLGVGRSDQYCFHVTQTGQRAAVFLASGCPARKPSPQCRHDVVGRSLRRALTRRPLQRCRREDGLRPAMPGWLLM